MFKRLPKLWRSTRLLLPLAVVLAASSPPAAQAGYQSASFTFNVSNVFPPGSYGTVLLEAYTGPDGSQDHGLFAGQVRFTVTADMVPAYGDPANATHFGIQKFGWNTDLFPYPTDIVVTKTDGTNLNWTINTDQNISNFGVFSVEDVGTGKTRNNPIVVTISSLGGNATIDHFIFLSDPNGGSIPAYFVAHVAGFNEGQGDDGTTSHFIAVTDITPVPIPSAIALGLIGMAGVGAHRWRRRHMVS